MKLKKFRFKKVKSTNNTAIKLAKSLNYKCGMVISDTQLNGRGQYGKKWISIKGNLFVSFFYELKNINLSLSVITKINCLLVKKLISNYYNKNIYFKKPNDLLIKNRKICGILQETVNKLKRQYLIVGIGINLVKSPNIKDYPATNLYDLTNKRIPKKKIENELKKIFEKNLSKFYNKKKDL